MAQNSTSLQGNEKRSGILSTKFEPGHQCCKGIISKISKTLFRPLAANQKLCAFRVVILEVQFGYFFPPQPRTKQNRNYGCVADSNWASVFYTVLDEGCDFVCQEFSTWWQCFSNNRR